MPIVATGLADAPVALSGESARPNPESSPDTGANLSAGPGTNKPGGGPPLSGSGGRATPVGPPQGGEIAPDTSVGTGPAADRTDCNGNGTPDDEDIANGTSQDCNNNGTPDECDVGYTSADCDNNGVPDECQSNEDCNNNGTPDFMDIAGGYSQDCQPNGIPDECDLSDRSGLVGELLDPENPAMAEYVDIRAGRVFAEGDTLTFEMEMRGTIPTAWQPDERVTFLWLVDLDYNAATGQPHGELGSEFNVRAVMWDQLLEGYVDVTGFFPGGGTGTVAVNGNFITLTIQSAQIAYAKRFRFRCDAFGYGGGIGGENNGGETTIGEMDRRPSSGDCNYNATPDECDLAGGWGTDCQPDGTPDECQLGCPWGSVPAQDNCADAEAICSYVQYTGTTSGATSDGLSCWQGCPDVWYTFTPATDGMLVVSLCGSTYDTVLAVYGGCPGDGSNELGCNDDWCDLQSMVQVDVTAGNPYWIKITGHGCDFGNFVLQLFGPDCVGGKCDCNGNGTPDDCDVGYTSADCDNNGVPDECQPPDDCNYNNMADFCDIAQGTSSDCQPNGTPDECDLASHNCCFTGHGPGCSDPLIQACVCANDSFCCTDDWDGYCVGGVEARGCGSCRDRDCNENTIPDDCDIVFGSGTSDCQPNGIPDQCDVLGAGSQVQLLHRYSFVDGLRDSIGGSDGTFLGDAHVAGGALVLDGDGDYAELPVGGTIAGLNEITLEAWVVWNGGGYWQRICDIGTDNTNYMFLTPLADSGMVRFGIATPATGEQIIEGNTVFPAGVLTHVAVALGANGYGRLYLNGTAIGENGGLTIKPLDLGGATIGYLGKSFYDDPYLDGRIAEFRIYGRALNAVQIAASFAAGPGGVIGGSSLDCNHNGIPDECDIASGFSADCQPNGIPDECDLAGGPVGDIPPSDMTEQNAGSWAAWSDGGTITVSDHPDWKQVGQASLRIETDGCYDNYVRYPGDQSAQWNLSGVQSIRVWFWAENPNDPDFQSHSPWIRLNHADGYYEWVPNDEVLNQAVGQWMEFTIPILGDATWTRTENGTPDLTDIHYVEIHADTWDCGFTLWIDGLRFVPQPTTGSADCNGNGIHDQCDMMVAGALYGVDPWGSALYLLDPETVQMSLVAYLTGLDGAHALTFGPGLGGTLYALVDANSTGFYLARIDRQSGAVDIVGTLDSDIADIAFGPGHKLYGLRGENGAHNGEIVVISTSDASVSSLGITGSGGWRHSIAFQPGTNLLYHVSCSYGCQLETIDLVSGNVQLVAPTEPSPYDALTYDRTGDRLLGTTAGALYAIDPLTGAETYLGYSDTSPLEGLAYSIEIEDCNDNGVLDQCDISSGASLDANGNGVPDECEIVFDCNHNGIEDTEEIAAGSAPDCNVNGVPDECEDENTRGLAAAYYDKGVFT